jgi:hypothetical protein
MTVDRYQTSSSYVHPQDSNLLNLHKAMQYNSTGEPAVRVLVGAEGITFTGEVTIPGKIEVYNTASDPLHTHLLEMGNVVLTDFMPIRGTVTATQGTTPWVITGTVGLDAFTLNALENVTIQNNVTATVTGVVSVNNFPTNFTVLQGTVPWRVAATGTVALDSATLAALENISVQNNVTATVTGTVTVNQGTTPWIVNGNVTATIAGTISPEVANPDAFGRARVSELFTLGDYKHIYAIDPNFIDKITNGGSVTFYLDQAAARLETTSTSTASVVIHQTKFYHHYQPGKSQLIYSSFNFYAPHRNVTKRTGYFDDDNGIYFEQVGSNTADGSTVSTTTQTLNWVIRTYVGGGANEADYSTTVNGVPYTYKRRVPQSDWNVDRCDGTGPSGFKLDITKTQLCWIDFQWLGVGRVRCGFVHNGEAVVAHEYFHSNVLPTVYISNPNLPVRCEIRNTGAQNAGGGFMDQVCSSVMSEGGYTESGIDWAIYTTERATPTPGRTRLPLVAIRLKNTFQGYPNRVTVRPNSLGLFAKTEPIVFEVGKLPDAGNLSTTDVGGLVWISADNDSAVEYCVNATSFTTSTFDRFSTGYVPAGSSQNSLSPVATGALTSAKKNVISQNIESTNSEVFLVVVSTIYSGNQLTADVACALQWREIY